MHAVLSGFFAGGVRLCAFADTHKADQTAGRHPPWTSCCSISVLADLSQGKFKTDCGRASGDSDIADLFVDRGGSLFTSVCDFASDSSLVFTR